MDNLTRHSLSLFFLSCVACSVRIHQRPEDLEVNVCKTKAVTNMRKQQLPPIDMSLDACVEFLAQDEILEVTPSIFRMAKDPEKSKKRGGKK